MKVMTKRQSKALDRRIERLYYATCSGIQINIMDIGKVFSAGRDAASEGLTDDALGQRIRGFVDTIRKN